MKLRNTRPNQEALKNWFILHRDVPEAAERVLCLGCAPVSAWLNLSAFVTIICDDYMKGAGLG